MIEARSKNQIGQPAAWIMANTRNPEVENEGRDFSGAGAATQGESHAKVISAHLAPYPQMLWIRLCAACQHKR